MYTDTQDMTSTLCVQFIHFVQYLVLNLFLAYF
jgi:hypothetical protein